MPIREVNPVMLSSEYIEKAMGDYLFEGRPGVLRSICCVLVAIYWELVALREDRRPWKLR